MGFIGLGAALHQDALLGAASCKGPHKRPGWGGDEKFWEQPTAAFPKLLAESNAAETPIGRRLLQGLAIFEEKQGYGETTSYEEVQKKGAAKGRRKKRAARS